MLTHSINIYKPVIFQPTHPVPQHTIPKMGKMEYNAFLARVLIKKGEYVINRFIQESSYSTLSVHGIFKVVDIQEIHYMCEYDIDVKGICTPKCVHLENNTGVKFWTTPSQWTTCPDVLLQRFNYANPQHQVIPY